MIHYLREGKLPFDKMSENQRKDFRRMAKNYWYDDKKDKLFRIITTGRRQDKRGKRE